MSSITESRDGQQGRMSKQLNRLTIFIVSILIIRAVPCQQIKFLSPDLKNLGKIMEGTVITDTIRFINTTAKEITISYIRTSCGCSVADIDKNRIAPLDTAEIRVTIDTRGFRGMHRKDVKVAFADKDIGVKKFVYQFTTYRPMEHQPKYFYLKNIRVNPDTTITLVLRIINNQKKSLIKIDC